MNDPGPIAVFDSGVGGLSVLTCLCRLMPEEDYLYLGDRAHAPYGDRTHDEVRALAAENAARLFALGAKALVVACNTATAAAVEFLRRTWPDRIIVGIEPAVKPAFEHGCRRILVLATPRTVREERFARLCGEYEERYGGRAVGVPCEGLSEMIEQMGPDVPADYFDRLFAPYREEGFDGVVLGCTHYPFAREAILRAAGGEIPVFDGAEGTARQTRRRLEAAGLLADRSGTRGRVGFVGDGGEVERFYRRIMKIQGDD